MLYAFDLLELDGDNLRGMPLGDRKKRLARLLSGRRLGIVLSDHTDEDGATHPIGRVLRWTGSR
jgi:bifunctional non-homologous end joining protein LigD